jgi:hypothetical protein
MFKVPNQYRITKAEHPILGSDSSLGNAGAFKIPLPKEEDTTYAFVIASEGEGWEHVSVHIIESGIEDTPLWDELCYIKNLFWDEEDCAVQFHPPKSQYVNNHPCVLHLWRKQGYEFPLPHSYLVGIK